MKKGQVYKVFLKDDDFVGVYLGRHSVYSGYNVFCMLNGEEKDVYDEDIIKLTSTRLKSEVRESFKRIYEVMKEIGGIKKEEEKLRNKQREASRKLEAAKELLRKQTGMYKIQNILGKYSDNITDWKEEKEGYLVKFSLIVKREKYANPDSNSMVYWEYDGTLGLYDNIDLSKNEKYIPKDLDHLNDVLSSITFVKTECEVSLGDKNTVIEDIVFTFRMKKSGDVDSIKEDLGTINDWIERHTKEIELERTPKRVGFPSYGRPFRF